jgi:hypothetical protein
MLVHRNVGYQGVCSMKKETKKSCECSYKLIWPGLHIIHGRSRTLTTQGSVERSNGDFIRSSQIWLQSL